MSHIQFSSAQLNSRRHTILLFNSKLYLLHPLLYCTYSRGKCNTHTKCESKSMWLKNKQQIRQKDIFFSSLCVSVHQPTLHILVIIAVLVWTIFSWDWGEHHQDQSPQTPHHYIQVMCVLASHHQRPGCWPGPRSVLWCGPNMRPCSSVSWSSFWTLGERRLKQSIMTLTTVLQKKSVPWVISPRTITTMNFPSSRFPVVDLNNMVGNHEQHPNWQVAQYRADSPFCGLVEGSHGFNKNFPLFSIPLRAGPK